MFATFTENVYIENVDFGEVGESVPLATEVVLRPDKHNGPQFLRQQIRRAQRHDEVDETEARRILVRECTDYDVAAETLLGSRLFRLQIKVVFNYSIKYS